MLRCGLLGEKLGHSYSHMIHARLADYRYELKEVAPERLDAFIEARNFRGLNVTIPYKQAVMKHCSRAMIIRTAWLYSIYGNNFVKTMLRLGRERETLGVVFDQIGTPTYANDLARAIFAAISQGIVPGIYHFSNEGVCSWYDFTLAIHRLAGIKSCKVSPLHTDEFPAKAPRPHYSVLDKTKIKKTFGIDIPHWEASLAVCMKNLEE